MKNNKIKNLEFKETNLLTKRLIFLYLKIIFGIMILLLYFLIKNNRKKIPTICLCLMGKRENLYVEEYINY